MDSNKRYFQWLVGEKRGQIMIFENIEYEDGANYIVFKDNSRINEQFVAQLNQTDITGKLMAEIDSLTNIWRFEEKKLQNQGPRIEQDANSGERFEIPSADEIAHANLTGESGSVTPIKPKNKIVTLIPPRPTAPTHSVFGMISNKTQPIVTVSVQNMSNTNKKIDTSDPVYILMSKSKKIDTEISMNISISLPPKNLYDIAKESFEEGEKSFVEYIIQNITVDEIKEALKVAITQMYESQKI